MSPITPEVLWFFEGKPCELSLYEALAGRILAEYPEAVVKVKKTQIGFYDGGLFCCVSLTPVRRKAERPERFITVTFGLRSPLDDPRALPVKVRENRWTHHVIVGNIEEIDETLTGWIEQSHSVVVERKYNHA